MTIYSGCTHWKGWFSIVMLVYQRVTVQLPPFSSGFFSRSERCVFTVFTHGGFRPAVLIRCRWGKFKNHQVTREFPMSHRASRTYLGMPPSTCRDDPITVASFMTHQVCCCQHQIPYVWNHGWFPWELIPKIVYTKGGFSLLVPIFPDLSSIPWGKLTSALPDSQLQETPHQDPGWWPSPTSSAGLWWPGFNQSNSARYREISRLAMLIDFWSSNC